MPHINTDRQSSAERQQARAAKPSATVIPFSARVTITEEVGPPPNEWEAVAPEPEQAKAPPSDRRSFDAKRFAWIDRVILDRDLSPLAKLVAVRIGLKYLNRTGGAAWPAQTTLATELNVTRQGIQSALNALVRARHITVVVARGRGHTNRYHPTFGALNANDGWHTDDLKRQPGLAVSDEPEVPPKMPTGAEENANGDEIKCQPLSAQSILRENHLKKNHRKEEDISAAIDFDLKDAAIGNESNGGERERTTALVSYGGDLKAEGDRPAPPKNGFCAFWDVYPLKVGKDRAKGIYAKIIKSRKATAEELLAGAVRYAAVRDSEDSQFTKHPSTWLNGGCWTDELKPPRKPKSTKQSFAEAAMTGFDGFLRNDGHE